ncbi:hypothetical protein CBM2587_A230134 [Cupriavidus taiwanensis]|uniref:Uncharacterized protein n=1 Tax=Cupriavidus taiwanensis TaxID=164546 RepID=A0A975X0R4_9BURK|nr:hypothetical protein CBM2587_A230134 [Cupriavidus taiwanensis]
MIRKQVRKHLIDDTDDECPDLTMLSYDRNQSASLWHLALCD